MNSSVDLYWFNKRRKFLKYCMYIWGMFIWYSVVSVPVLETGQTELQGFLVNGVRRPHFGPERMFHGENSGTENITCASPVDFLPPKYLQGIILCDLLHLFHIQQIRIKLINGNEKKPKPTWNPQKNKAPKNQHTNVLSTLVFRSSVTLSKKSLHSKFSHCLQ